MPLSIDREEDGDRGRGGGGDSEPKKVAGAKKLLQNNFMASQGLGPSNL